MNYSKIIMLLITIFFLNSCENNDPILEPNEPLVTDSKGRPISSKDNFIRKTIQVGETADEFMSYIDEGNGDPILLLHGAPSNSYLWRNIIPYLSDNARVIAPDWIGTGRSGFSPGNDYTYLKQLEYLTSFIDKLNLNNITLVLHDWSTITALPYAHQHQDKIKAIATFEAVYFPIPSVDVMPELAQQFIGSEGERMIVDENAFMKIMLPGFTLRDLTETEKENYSERWETKENRFALLAVPKGLPIGGQPEDLWNQFGAASMWFAQSSTELPKFFTYTTEGPGVLVTDAIADPSTGASIIDIVSSFSNTVVKPIDGPGMHFIQEDYPHDLGILLSEWYDSL